MTSKIRRTQIMVRHGRYRCRISVFKPVVFHVWSFQQVEGLRTPFSPMVQSIHLMMQQYIIGTGTGYNYVILQFQELINRLKHILDSKKGYLTNNCIGSPYQLSGNLQVNHVTQTNNSPPCQLLRGVSCSLIQAYSFGQVNSGFLRQNIMYKRLYRPRSMMLLLGTVYPH